MWQGISGHDAVAEHFRHSLAQGRLASSYLFLGPSGVGKRTFALKLAEALLCQQSTDTGLEPCGNCESCRLAGVGAHPDLDVIGLPPGTRWLPVERFLGDRDHRNQQGLCHDISLRPRLGQRRVAVIDDADSLTIESSNCLLKTLEEPPPGAVLILIATSRSRLLPTILSRTQVVRFQPLAADVIEQLLLEQGIAADQAQARLLAENCQGRLQRARQLADEHLWELRRWLLPQLTAGQFTGPHLAGRLQEFIQGAGKEADARRGRLRLVLQIVAEHFREILRLSCQVGTDATNTASVAATQVRELGISAQQCAISVLDRCLEAEVQLDRNANQATLLECWLDDLAGILSGSASVSTL